VKKKAKAMAEPKPRKNEPNTWGSWSYRATNEKSIDDETASPRALSVFRRLNPTKKCLKIE